MHRRLGDAIHIDELRTIVAMTAKPSSKALWLERFAAKDDKPERQGFIRAPHRILCVKLIKARRRLIQHRYRMRCQEIMERFGRTADPIWNDDQSSPVKERSKYLPDRKIEGKGMKQRPDIRRWKSYTRPPSRQRAAQHFDG